ncbi:hypothetical protein BDV27DRAFT_122401, partial [Aspergillus caelatus]
MHPASHRPQAYILPTAVHRSICSITRIIQPPFTPNRPRKHGILNRTTNSLLYSSVC